MKRIFLTLFICLYAIIAYSQKLSDLVVKSTIAGTEKIPVSGSGYPGPAVTPNLLYAFEPKYFGMSCGDLISVVSAGTTKAYLRIPKGFTVTAVRASLLTAQSSGSIITIDINENGTTILSTKLTIDNSEKTSTTAATAAVISDATLADDAEITVDVDQVGSSPVGLIVWLIGY